MAMSDYCLCEVCGMKTFYDANLNYEPSDKAREDGGCSLERTAAMSAICKDCWAKGYRLKVLSSEDIDEIASLTSEVTQLRADLANAGAVMVEACAREADAHYAAGDMGNPGHHIRALFTLSPIAAAARVLLADPDTLDGFKGYILNRHDMDTTMSGYAEGAMDYLRALAEQERDE